MTARTRNLLSGLLWTSPWLVGFGVFLFLPLAMSLWYSFTDYPLLKPPVYIGLENYTGLLHDDKFWLVVKNTLVYSAFAIPLSTLVSLVVAAWLATPGLRARGFFLGAVFLPTLVPMMAAAMVWLWLFNAENGLINVLLKFLGLSGPIWLNDARWSIPALVLTGIWGVGQMVVVYVAAINEVPASLYEAATLDGMGPVRRFRHVTLPLITPAVLFNVITLTIGSLQIFVMPYVLFRNEQGQRDSGNMYNLLLYDNAFVYSKFGYASAMAWVQLLVVLALTGIMMLASKRLVHYRGAA